MKRIRLNNGVEMPAIMMGTSIDDRKGSRKALRAKMVEVFSFAIQNGIVGYDTSRDYGNEQDLGVIFNNLIRNNVLRREDLFITTKVGNGQQYVGKMEAEIDKSLKNFKLDYIDLWLLHWPLSHYYIDNWKQICRIYESGKVKAIGIANCRPRHIIELENAGVEVMPHVFQFEYHPFRTVPEMIKMCDDRNIQVEAYSANCVMLPFVRENEVLNQLAEKYNKTLTQIMMRWHVQQGTIPIFSSLSQNHILDNINVFDFEISDVDMKAIYNLNIDYKFHPESLNCPGY